MEDIVNAGLMVCNSNGDAIFWGSSYLVIVSSALEAGALARISVAQLLYFRGFAWIVFNVIVLTW